MYSLSTPLNILLCNLPAFHKHYNNEKPFRASLNIIYLLIRRQASLVLVHMLTRWNIKGFKITLIISLPALPQLSAKRDHKKFLTRQGFIICSYTGVEKKIFITDRVLNPIVTCKVLLPHICIEMHSWFMPWSNRANKMCLFSLFSFIFKF